MHACNFEWRQKNVHYDESILYALSRFYDHYQNNFHFLNIWSFGKLQKKISDFLHISQSQWTFAQETVISLSSQGSSPFGISFSFNRFDIFCYHSFGFIPGVHCIRVSFHIFSLMWYLSLSTRWVFTYFQKKIYLCKQVP